MTTLPSARRRAEEFADAVDSVLAQDGTGGLTPAPEAASLLDIVVALRSVPAPSAPRPEFTADLRERLLVEAASVLVPPQPVRVAEPAEVGRVPVRRTRPGRLVAAASAFVVVGGTAGVATAAQRALPGEALYPVKRALEGAELRLSTSDAGRGRGLLDQATNRLDELESLLPATTSSGAAAASVAARLPGTVQAFTSQAVAGSGLLLEAFESEGDPATVEEVRSFTAASVASLSELAAVAPSEVRDELAGAAATMQSVDESAVALCPACGEGDPAVEVPPDFGVPPEDEVVGGGAGGSSEAGDSEVTPAGEESQAPGASREDGGPGPTEVPSDSPTPTEPTDPTDMGTDPTDPIDPTDGATDGPSGTPSDAPSDDPTDDPSDDPSDDPTDDPSDGPSDTPSGEPSESPSDVGTGGGTGVNSGDDPSDKPSEDPGGEPSDDSVEDPVTGGAEERSGGGRGNGGGHGGGNGGGRDKHA